MTSDVFPLTYSNHTAYLQAMRTVLWAWNCCPVTITVTSVMILRLRRRLKLKSTSPACRVNWMQSSAMFAIAWDLQQQQKIRLTYQSQFNVAEMFYAESTEMVADNHSLGSINYSSHLTSELLAYTAPNNAQDNVVRLSTGSLAFYKIFFFTHTTQINIQYIPGLMTFVVCKHFTFSTVTCTCRRQGIIWDII